MNNKSADQSADVQADLRFVLHTLHEAGFLMNWLKWATSLFMPYVNNKGADQPAHRRSLISAFIVRFLDSIVSLVPVSEISSL